MSRHSSMHINPFKYTTMHIYLLCRTRIQSSLINNNTQYFLRIIPRYSHEPSEKIFFEAGAGHVFNNFIYNPKNDSRSMRYDGGKAKIIIE